MKDFIVIKIGGSSLRTGNLKQSLNLILRRQRSIVLVPGGGAYADIIRNTQTEFGFSDCTAHNMALLAMHQFAFIIREFSQEFIICELLEEFSDILKDGKIPLWAPIRMVQSAQDVPRNWMITSDGLSAWLTIKLGGEEVCLLKSCTIPENQSLQELRDNGIIDQHFSSVVEQNSLKWSVLTTTNEKEILKRIS